jgi:hypothetical protein
MLVPPGDVMAWARAIKAMAYNRPTQAVSPTAARVRTIA